jgi:hypothetical protein
LQNKLQKGQGADPEAMQDAVHRFPAGRGIRSTDKKQIKAEHNQVKEKNHGKS